MTIKLTVTNDDTRENAVVEVKRHFDNGLVETIKKLKGGESTTVWIHRDVKVVVEEIQNG